MLMDKFFAETSSCDIYIKRFKPRFEEIKQEKMNNSYNNESIQKKLVENKFLISTKGRIKKFLQARKKKELD